MNKCVFYSLDLTTKNNLTGGFKKRHKDVTKEELKKAVANDLRSIRRKAQAKGREWRYIILAIFSNKHSSKGGYTGAWHCHMIIYGSPAYTIASEIKSYWTSKGYGNSKQQELKACWNSGKLGYNMIQMSDKKLEKHGIFAAELREELSKKYYKSDLETAFKIARLDGDKVTLEGFMFFARCSSNGYSRSDTSNT